MLSPRSPLVGNASAQLQAEEDAEVARLLHLVRSAREKDHQSFAALPQFFSRARDAPVDSSPGAAAGAWRARAAQQRLGLEALHRWT
jgi:predicted extracellular nuclease